MYSDRHDVEIGRLYRSARTRFCAGAVSIWGAGGIAVFLLVGAGIAYRVAADRFEGPPPIAPLVPLAEVPIDVGQWKGEALGIPTVTDAYMRTNFADDYISRRYVHEAGRMWADAYIVYCASRPAGLLGHQPMVCFPAHGWIHDGTSTSAFETRSGRRVECLVHRFHKPVPDTRRVVVLSFYVLNGHITLREGDFSGLFGRGPNISGDPARYVAQIQISSVLEHSARALASDLADSVLAILPDAEGNVRWPLSPAPASQTEETAEQDR